MKGLKMKHTLHKITVRMTSAEKKLLDELALKTGFSINKTVIDCVLKTNQADELKGEISSLKDNLNLVANGINQLSENSAIQSKAISGMVEIFRTKGLV